MSFRPWIKLTSTILLFASVSTAKGQQSTGLPVSESNSSGTAESNKHFESTIRPLLIKECLDCHSGDDPEGGFSLTSRDAILEGGDSGASVVPGDPEASLLWEAISYQSLEMPPDSKLSEKDQQAIRAWIEDGLFWPNDVQLAAQRTEKKILPEDRDYWAFRPLNSVAPPMVHNADWCRTDLDNFVLSKLESAQLSPAPPATRRAILRRLSFDLTGLPPSLELQQQFLSDQPQLTYDELVDLLLSSPEFGQHWADYWLDLVRFAESDGYKADDFRVSAWRYRDYVIKSLNADKPFDQFALEQLAGDLLPDATADQLVATGFLRNWIYEYNQRDARSQWQYVLDDMTEVTGDVFLGLSLGCSKCHDHKYDPLLQTDYYNLQACFSGVLPRDDVPVADAASRRAYLAEMERWLTRTENLRAQLELLEGPIKQPVAAAAIRKFPPDIRELFPTASSNKVSSDPSPDSLTQQLRHLVQLQVDIEVGKIDFSKKLKGDDLERWKSLRQQLDEVERDRPPSLPTTLGVAELDNVVFPSIEGRKEVEIQPAIPVVLAKEMSTSDLHSNEPPRLALGRWVGSTDNPITARVMANRVWQQIMGTGLAANPSDFGTLGGEPSHTELLDHMAWKWRETGWSLKQLIREMVLSSTYRMATLHPESDSMSSIDPDNRLLWRAHPKRLTASQLRDALLASSGELKLLNGGPSQGHAALCRTVYVKVLRNTREPLLDQFDFPDRIRSHGQRNRTTTPLQALLLVNGDWIQHRAQALGKRAQSKGAQDERAGVDWLFQTTLARPVTPEEAAACLEFLEQQRTALETQFDSESVESAVWQDLSHSLLNSNEFLYLD